MKKKLKTVCRNIYTESGIEAVDAYDIPEPIQGLRLFVYKTGRSCFRVTELTTGFCVIKAHMEDLDKAITMATEKLIIVKNQIATVIALARRTIGEKNFPVNRLSPSHDPKEAA